MERDAELEELRAALAARDLELAARDLRIAELEATVKALIQRLDQNSNNSNKPPSSDPPDVKIAKRKARRKKEKQQKKKRGAQKRHKGSHRALVAPELVDHVVDVFPSECESCWERLPEEHDAFAKRYQQTDLKPVAAHVTEWRRHAVACPHCGYKTRAKYDREVFPRYAFGPRLTAVVAMLTGVYHLSRRATVRLIRDLLGVRISLGAVMAIEKRMSAHVAAAVEEAVEVARGSSVKHVDGTTWFQCGIMRSIWVLASNAATVFMVLKNGRAATLRDELLGHTRGLLVSDRASALMFWPMKRRQICWAHLLRKFVSFSERDGPAGTFGKELLDYARLIFSYWRRWRDRESSRVTFVSRMAPVRALFESLLERVAAAKLRDISGSCENVLNHRDALWSFVDRVGVEPTNNHAERELRGFVMWRRRSFGSQSEHGDRFAARLMTIAHTARKQGVEILNFLHECSLAALQNSASPSLFA